MLWVRSIKKILFYKDVLLEKRRPQGPQGSSDPMLITIGVKQIQKPTKYETIITLKLSGKSIMVSSNCLTNKSVFFNLPRLIPK